MGGKSGEEAKMLCETAKQKRKIVNFHTAASLSSSSSSCHQHRLIAILIIVMIVFFNILNVHGHGGKENGEQGVVRDPRTVTSSAPVELEQALVKRPRARGPCVTAA